MTPPLPNPSRRVLVLGGTGMLGHKLWQVFRARFDAAVTVRCGYAALEHLDLFERHRTFDHVEASDHASVAEVLTRFRPRVVVNCIGIVKQAPEARDPVASIEVNSLFPHRLAALCSGQGARLIQVGTDCVFSGRRGLYSEDDLPEPLDLYGRSKLLGEVDQPHLTIRTSLIGRQVAGSAGLVEWFLRSGPRVRGYTQAFFSGLTTRVVANVLAEVIERHPQLAGLYHVSTDRISKYELLRLLRAAYGRDVEIEPSADLVVDRSLRGERFRQATGIQVPGWAEMAEAMASDPDPYEAWRSVHA